MLKHLDTSTPPPTSDGYSPFQQYHFRPHSNFHSHGAAYEYDEDEEDDDDQYDSEAYYDSEGECYYEEEEENLDFFMYALFS